MGNHIYHKAVGVQTTSHTFSGDTRTEKTLENAILSDLQHHYIGEALLFLSKAVFLDPRFKCLIL